MSVRRFLTAIAPVVITLLTWQVAAHAVLRFRGVASPTPWETFVRLADLLGGKGS